MVVAQTHGGLVERERELAALAELVGQAARGEGGAIAVEGAPGVGKTSLLDALRGILDASSARVAIARGAQLERDIPFGVARQLLGPIAVELERDDLAPFAGAAELAREVLDSPVPNAPEVASDASARALHGLYWFTANLAERRPLILVVDDAHLADRPSLQWLLYMAQRVAELPVAMVVATRAVVPGSDPLLDRLLSPRGPGPIRLGPLSEEATRAMVAAWLGRPGDDAFCAACHRATGGNPLLLTEMLRELVRKEVEPTGAAAASLDALDLRSLRHAIGARLDTLPDPCRRVAEAVAVLGEGHVGPDLARFADLDPLEVADALPQLADAGILAVRDDAVAFAHPIVRATVEGALVPRKRAAGHARAFEQLAADGAGPVELSVHAMACAPSGDARVVSVLLDAARAARAQGALEPARGLLERALREPPAGESRGHVLAELGAIELRLGREASVARLEEATRIARGTDEGVLAARDLATGLVRHDPVRAMTVLAEAARALPGEDDLAVMLEAHAWGLSFANLRARDSFRDAFGAPVAATRAPRTLREQLATRRAALETALTGTAEDALALARGATERIELDELLGFESMTRYIPANVLREAGALDAALATINQTLDAARAAGSITGCALATHTRAEVWLDRGSLADVEADAADAPLALAPFNSPHAPACAVVAMLERGDLSGAQRVARDSGLDRISPDGLAALNTLSARARLRVAEGHLDAALADLDEAAAVEERWGVTTPALSTCRADRALVLHALGRAAEARAIADDAVSQARAFGALRQLGIALRAAGVVGEDLGLLEEAAAQLAGSSARLEHARALVEYGAALRRAGREAEARDQLRAAGDLAQECGASELGDRALTELRAAGGRRRRASAGRRTALTPRERRVATMAAAGKANKEIAQALFLSEKTIESDLTSCYRKLGIDRRAKLAAALRRAGLTSGEPAA